MTVRKQAWHTKRKQLILDSGSYVAAAKLLGVSQDALAHYGKGHFDPEVHRSLLVRPSVSTMSAPGQMPTPDQIVEAYIRKLDEYRDQRDALSIRCKSLESDNATLKQQLAAQESRISGLSQQLCERLGVVNGD